MENADLENAAELALTAFCWWRGDLSRELCETYWRDVHGIMFARAPGLWQYRQLRLGPNRPELGPADSGIALDVPEPAQPQGLPHGLFRSRADLEEFGNNPIAREVIPGDAHNFIARIGALLSPSQRGRTLVDRLDHAAVQGVPPVPTFALCFVSRGGADSAGAFHRCLIEHVARPWSAHPRVLRLRVEPLPPYEQSAMPVPGVPHQWPNSDTYLGWIELAVGEEEVVRELLAGVAARGLAEQVGAVHCYPVREIYTLISGGRPTEVGLRGYPAVQTILAAGAHEQRSDAVLGLLFGEAARGLDRLSPGT